MGSPQAPRKWPSSSDVWLTRSSRVLSLLPVGDAPLPSLPSQVRTRDRIFDSISHLINHHLENKLPIVSAGSELCLQQPVERSP